MEFTSLEEFKKYRSREMHRQRFELGWTLQMVGDYWHLTRGRAQQIIGPSGWIHGRGRRRKLDRDAGC